MRRSLSNWFLCRCLLVGSGICGSFMGFLGFCLETISDGAKPRSCWQKHCKITAIPQAPSQSPLALHLFTATAPVVLSPVPTSSSCTFLNLSASRPGQLPSPTTLSQNLQKISNSFDTNPFCWKGFTGSLTITATLKLTQLNAITAQKSAFYVDRVLVSAPGWGHSF